MVFVTAILQDACLSIKVASNLAEREVPPQPKVYFYDGFSFIRFYAWGHGTVSLAVRRQHMFVEMECFRSSILIRCFDDARVL